MEPLKKFPVPILYTFVLKLIGSTMSLWKKSIPVLWQSLSVKKRPWNKPEVGLMELSAVIRKSLHNGKIWNN